MTLNDNFYSVLDTAEHFTHDLSPNSIQPWNHAPLEACSTYSKSHTVVSIGHASLQATSLYEHPAPKPHPFRDMNVSTRPL